MAPRRWPLKACKVKEHSVVASTKEQASPSSARLVAPWIVLGSLGAIGMVIFGASIGAAIHPGVHRWWFNVVVTPRALAETGFYGSIAVLVAGWIGVGFHARHGRLGLGLAWCSLLAWGLPLFLGQPLFSRDIYSYVAQGLIAHRGLNPYNVAPTVLDPSTAFSSVATVWHKTTSPYGPGFLGISKLTIGIAGHGPVAQIMAFRALELLGVGLMMVAMPVLARRNGNDPGLGLWLAALSPLALFGFVASAHNDALMIGLMIAGLAVVSTGRLGWGMALMALGSTVKLPALGAIVFVAVDRYSAAADTKERRRVILDAVGIPLVIIAGMTTVVGYGWGWLGPKALRIPTELRILTTPLVAVATFLDHLLHAIGIPVRLGGTETVVLLVGEIASVLVIILLLVRVPGGPMLRLLGLALLVVVLGSPTIWPWYWLWGVSVLAASDAQRSKALAVLACVGMLVVGAGGTPLLGGWTFWVTGPLLLVGGLWVATGGRWRRLIAPSIGRALS